MQLVSSTCHDGNCYSAKVQDSLPAGELATAAPAALHGWQCAARRQLHAGCPSLQYVPSRLQCCGPACSKAPPAAAKSQADLEDMVAIDWKLKHQRHMVSQSTCFAADVRVANATSVSVLQ